MSPTNKPPKYYVLHDRFVTHEQQKDVSLSGMWLFLATEVMFFGALFGCYTVYRIQYPDMFHVMSKHMDVVSGAVNTAILLTASLFMALAVKHARNAEPGDSGRTVLGLFLSQLAGLAFLGIKAHDWLDLYQHGLWPGHWSYNGPFADTGHLYFWLYYALVGLHGVHVVIGVALINWFMVRAYFNHYSKYHYIPLEVLGLYWSYVDCIWVFLFPLFYLIDPK